MNEEYFHKLGFEGELEQYASGRVIASKNQGIAFVEYTEGMIVLGTGPQIFIRTYFEKKTGLVDLNKFEILTTRSPPISIVKLVKLI